MVFLWFSYGLLKVIALIFVTLRRPSSGLPRDPRPAQRPFVRCRSHRPWSRHWGWTSSNDAVANVQQIPGGFFFNWDNQLLRITHVVTCDVCLYEVYIYMIYMIYMYIFVFFDWDNQLLKNMRKPRWKLGNHRWPEPQAAHSWWPSPCAGYLGLEWLLKGPEKWRFHTEKWRFSWFKTEKCGGLDFVLMFAKLLYQYVT